MVSTTTFVQICYFVLMNSLDKLFIYDWILSQFDEKGQNLSGSTYHSYSHCRMLRDLPDFNKSMQSSIKLKLRYLNYVT